MLKNSLWGTTIAVLAGAGLLLIPTMSDAQNRGGRSGGGSWSRGGGGYGSYGRGGWNQGYGFGLGIYPGYYGAGAYGYYGADGRYYGGEGIDTAQPGYQSFYPPDNENNQGYAEPSQAPATDPNAAAFRVRVPDANAEIWFQDHKTQQRGTVRQYESASLNPNQSYTFHLRAKWTQNGREMDQSRDVQVRSGQHVTVDFSAPVQENVPAAPAAQLPRNIQDVPLAPAAQPPRNIPNVPETPATQAPRSIQPSR